MDNKSTKNKGRGGYRPGSGRPQIDNPKKPRSFKATDKEWELIQKKANQLGLTTSEYIRQKALE